MVDAFPNTSFQSAGEDPRSTETFYQSKKKMHCTSIPEKGHRTPDDAASAPPLPPLPPLPQTYTHPSKLSRDTCFVYETAIAPFALAPHSRDRTLLRL